MKIPSYIKSNVYKYIKNKYIQQPILDLGSGFFWDDIPEYAIDLYFNDASKHCEFITHDLNIKPYPPLYIKFKTIKCMRTIEYIEKPKVLISEAHRLLREDGIFIITCKNNISQHRRWIKENNLPMKPNCITDKILKEMLINEGFKVKQYNNFIKGFNYSFLQPLWQLVNPNMTYFVCERGKKCQQKFIF